MVSVRATSKKVKNNKNRKHENVILTRSKAKMINTVKYDEKKKIDESCNKRTVVGKHNNCGNNENRNCDNVIRTRSKSKLMNSMKYDDKKEIDGCITNKQEILKKSKNTFKNVRKQNKLKNEIVEALNFKIGETILGKIKGYSYWPGKVSISS